MLSKRNYKNMYFFVKGKKGKLSSWGQARSDEKANPEHHHSSKHKDKCAQMGRCYTDKLCGGWANSKEAECLITAAELLALYKLILFQSVSLSRRTVAELITDVVQDIENALKENTRHLKFFFSLVRELLLSLIQEKKLPSWQVVHGTTKGEICLCKLFLAMDEFELQF